MNAEKMIREARTALVHAARDLERVLKAAEASRSAEARQIAERAKAEKAKAEKAKAELDEKAKTDDVGPVDLVNAEIAGEKAESVYRELRTALEKRLKKVEDRVTAVEDLVKPDAANPWVRRDDLGPLKEGLNAHADTLYGSDRNGGLVTDVASLRKEVDEISGHLGRTTNEDGTIGFADRDSSFPFNAPVGGLIGLAVAIVAFVYFWSMDNAVFTTALFWAVTLGLFATVIGGTIAYGISKLMRNN